MQRRQLDGLSFGALLMRTMRAKRSSMKVAAGNGLKPPSRAVRTRVPLRLFPPRLWDDPFGRLFLCHIRQVEILASFRECSPSIAHSDVIFAFFRVSSFLGTRCAFGGCFPGCLAFAGHKLFSRLLCSKPLQCSSVSPVPLLLRTQLCRIAGRSERRSGKKKPRGSGARRSECLDWVETASWPPINYRQSICSGPVIALIVGCSGPDSTTSHIGLSHILVRHPSQLARRLFRGSDHREAKTDVGLSAKVFRT
jgi:hypothetical protein